MEITLDQILTLLRKIIDVSIVWLMFYYILKRVRTNIKMGLLFKGLLFIAIIKIISEILNLVTVGLVLEYVIMWGPLAIIIIFQPEIREVLEHLGRSQLLGRHKTLTIDEREKLVFETIQSMEYLRKTKIGALIIIERDISLNEYIDKSIKLYADLTSELLISIFFPNNPLHDGAVIIQGNRITSAGAVLPVSDNQNISSRLGTRHRAALGISEVSDAIVLVVSEETGRISIAINSELHYNISIDEARMMLLNELKSKKETSFDEEDNEEETIDEEEIN